MNQSMPRDSTDRLDDIVEMITSIRVRMARMELGYLILLGLTLWLLFRG